MLASGMTPLVWPLLARLNPTVAAQRKPRYTAGRVIPMLPTLPWDDFDRPPIVGYGQVEGDPRASNTFPVGFGLAALGVPAVPLSRFLHPPRPHPLSEQVREPAVVKPAPAPLPGPLPPPARSDAKASRIIWPLRSKLFNPALIVAGAPANMTAAAAVPGVVALQQRPRVSIVALPTLPWARRRYGPAAVHPLPIPARVVMISGVTKDSNGAVLGNCVVELYLTATDEPLMKTTSNASGVYSFICARYSPATHYVVAYKAGSPDVAGTTVNTLIGS